MKNFVQEGENITVTAPRDVSAGEGVLVGDIFGIASSDALSGADVVLVRRGVFDHTKLEAQAWTQGAKMYWDNTNFWFTTAASGNKLVGAASEAAANPSTTGRVLLDGAVR